MSVSASMNTLNRLCKELFTLLTHLLVVFVVGKYSPNSRWGHSISMISEKEAVVIGGQGDKQAFCKDSIWYLNMGRFFFLLPYEIEQWV